MVQTIPHGGCGITFELDIYRYTLSASQTQKSACDGAGRESPTRFRGAQALERIIECGGHGDKWALMDRMAASLAGGRCFGRRKPGLLSRVRVLAAFASRGQAKATIDWKKKQKLLGISDIQCGS